MMNEYLTLCKDYTQFCCNLNPYDIMREDVPELMKETAETLLNEPETIADEIREQIEEDLFANEKERADAVALLSAVNAWIDDVKKGTR